MIETQKLMAYQFPACAEEMCTVRQKLRTVLAGCDQSDFMVNSVVLAVGEACMNIIQHAYGKDEKGDIVLEVELQRDGRNENMIFRLTDFATRKSCESEMRSRPLDEIRPGGLGCHIINQVMDEVKLLECAKPCGNVLQMRKNLAAGQAE